MQSDTRDLKLIYERYGFEFRKSYESGQVLVFTLKTGYFDNADIVPLADGADTSKAFEEFSKSGFACTVRPVQSSVEAEKLLFKGFFSVDSIRDRLKNDYQRFASSIVRPFSDSAVYKYMNAPYWIDGKLGEMSPPEEITSRLSQNKPVLFLVEAAAGFGKTCTAYELVKNIVERGDYLPLFSELSRNREARIFRHILLYEIDRTFPLLGSRLVQSEMINGRVVTILDGFDELLRKSDDGKEFENSEPMLETIGEFLQGSAKVILTTRRTILFEGDAFHTWVDKHRDDFDLVTIRISEPSVVDWLPQDRLSAINKSGVDVEKISNPVLLSYLRCISDDDFSLAVHEPERLVDRYFEFMLDRERIRQDLRINVPEQHGILQGIASDMLQLGYTSEHREYIVDYILSNNSKLIDRTLLAYSSSERPTKEEVANKLASHALLDRSSREPNKIGFINDFVLGHYVALAILGTKDWLSDDLRFIEPAVASYQPRGSKARATLWKSLETSLEFLDMTDMVNITIKLLRKIPFNLISGEVEGLTFDGLEIGEWAIKSFQFNDCVFRNCVFDPASFDTVTFLNCRFYGNSAHDVKASGAVFVLGAQGDEDFVNKLIASQDLISQVIQPDRQDLLDRFVLEKFWPVGRPTIKHKHRPIKGICVNNATFSPQELYGTIDSLKRRGLLLEPRNSQFVEINFDRVIDIQKILMVEGA